MARLLSSFAGPVSIEAIDKANPFYLNPGLYNHNAGCPVWSEMIKVAAIAIKSGSSIV